MEQAVTAEGRGAGRMTWTKAGDGRPEIGVNVLVTAEEKDGTRTVGLDWFDGTRFVRHEYGKHASKVVAWAPVPLPYTEDLG